MPAADVDDPEAVLLVTTWVAVAGVVISSCEWLSLRREFDPGGLYDWKVISVVHDRLGRRERLSRWVGSGAAVRLLLALRVAAAAALLVVPAALAPLPLTVLLVTHLFLHFRCIYGLEGSDQMQLVVLAALWVGSLAPAREVRVYCLVFVAVQACLSYFVAGVAKLFGPFWRDGTAVAAILNTRSFGLEAVAGVLARHPAAGAALTYLVLAFECTFPLGLFLPYPLVAAYLAAGAVFHLVNSYVMGLNMFVWSFLATYPAVLYCSRLISSALY